MLSTFLGFAFQSFSPLGWSKENFFSSSIHALSYQPSRERSLSIGASTAWSHPKSRPPNVCRFKFNPKVGGVCSPKLNHLPGFPPSWPSLGSISLPKIPLSFFTHAPLRRRFVLTLGFLCHGVGVLPLRAPTCRMFLTFYFPQPLKKIRCALIIFSSRGNRSLNKPRSHSLHAHPFSS